MVEMTIQMPDALANKIKPFGAWMPAILEISLLKFRTKAVAQASEIVEFLQSNPSPEEVLKFHASEEKQERLRKLLILGNEGLLSAEESQELDELEKLEHIVVMFKAGIGKDLKRKNGF